MRLVAALVLAAFPAGVAAQVSPTPGDDPRVQTVAYDPDQSVRLVAFPNGSLTVMLLRGEQIQRIRLSNPMAFDATAIGANDSVLITPLRPDGASDLLVDTGLRRYEFEVATGEGLAAAYLVRFISEADSPIDTDRPARAAIPETMTGRYRLSGEDALLPSRIGDDGTRTYLEWDAYQSLPAVFGIGFNGEEEVVDGYMRDGVFTIDRVYGELVFRVDKKRARARRTEKVGEG